MKEPLRRALVWGWLLVVLGMAILVIAYVLWGGPAVDRPNRAGVSGTLIATALLVPPVAVWAWRRRGGAAVETSTRAEVDAAADRLAEQTLETWSRQVVQRGIQRPAPVRVRWRWAADDVALPRQELTAAPSLATDPGPLPSSTAEPPRAGQVLNSGLVTRLHDEVYARLHHGRLVLIGGPGAGKTGAMILLLLEALRYRERMPEAARAGVPVPVWLTLGSWDPRSEDLRNWVTATISRDHPYLRAKDFGPDAVRQLFDIGRIALFLDGLDEMPDTLRDVAIERLTAEAAGRRVVITSRPEEFRETIDLGRRQLPYTAVIELRPVGPRAAAGYLLEGQIGAARQAWQHVADHLLAHPDELLAKTLDTPLTLSLARAAYTGDDPRALLTRMPADEHDLRLHLLDQVLIAAYSEPRERAHATYWLGWLAHKMGTQPNGPIRELCWWQIPSWIPRWQVGLVGGLVGGLLIAVGVWSLTVLSDLLLDEFTTLEFLSVARYNLMAGLILGLFGGLVVSFVTGLGVRAVAPRSISIRWPRLQNLGSMASIALRGGLVIGLPFGLAFVVLGVTGVFGLTEGHTEWLAIVLAGLILGLVSGLVGGLLVGVPLGLLDVWRIPLARRLDVTPRVVYQGDVRSHLVGGLMVGLMGGIASWSAIAAIGGMEPADHLVVGLMLGVMFGLTFGLVNGFRAGAAPSLLFTEVAFWPQGRRVRLMPLLETALARQVLRQAGAVYQFRHADLQDRLADRYQAGLMRRRAA